MRIAFLDMTCPKPYSKATLHREGLGGTEASVVRLAEGLHARGHEVLVSQHNRQATVGKTVRYGSLKPLMDFNPHAVIVLRQSSALAFIEQNFPNTARFLWLHDLEMPDRTQFRDNAALLRETRPRIITVSQSHKTNVIDTLKVHDPEPNYTVGTILNPIDDNLLPDETPYNKDKILFLSSPHKNLANAVKMFKAVRAKFPRVELHVANPGYLADAQNLPEGVVPLGQLKHSEVIKHLRESLCLFYPNPDWFTRETYGLVVAESLAVGTPAMVHNIGALNELITDSQMFVDGRSERDILRRFRKWYVEGRPKAELKAATRTSTVVKLWEVELERARLF